MKSSPAQKVSISLIDEAILLWKIIYYYIHSLKVRHGQDWYFVKHEDVSLNPVCELRKIFEYLSVDFTADVVNQIEGSTSGKIKDVLNRYSKANIKSWKTMLSPEETVKIKRETKEISIKFYSEESWN